MPLPSDKWADQVWRAGVRWRSAATPDDVAWMTEWYRANGVKGLWSQLDSRRAATLDLLRLPARTAQARVRKLPEPERRLQLLCCIRYSLIGWTLMQRFSSAGLDANLTAEFRLGQAAQVAEGLLDEFFDPWPFDDDPLEDEPLD